MLAGVSDMTEGKNDDKGWFKHLTVLTPHVTADSKIFLTHTSQSTGFLSVENIVPGVSFEIVSSNTNYNGTINWLVVNNSLPPVSDKPSDPVSDKPSFWSRMLCKWRPSLTLRTTDVKVAIKDELNNIVPIVEGVLPKSVAGVVESVAPTVVNAVSDAVAPVIVDAVAPDAPAAPDAPKTA
jgi:hypothetical protein